MTMHYDQKTLLHPKTLDLTAIVHLEVTVAQSLLPYCVLTLYVQLALKRTQ